MSSRACRVALLVLFSIFPFPFSSGAAAADQQELELRAKQRVLEDVGPGVTALKRDAAGRYYVLVALPNGAGSVVQIFDPEGKRVGQIPAGASPPQGKTGDAATSASIVFGDDLDLDADGRIYVADRGANAIKVYSPDGQLERSVNVAAPASAVALTDGEVAVTTMRPEHLVQVYDAKGRVLREFGVPEEIAERADLNRFLNLGRLATDAAHHVYRAFTNLPEPTVRKYDRFGFGLMEIALATIDFMPTARAARREIERQDEKGGTPALTPTIRAIGVDPETQHVWIATGGLLVHFDADGTRLGTYRIFTAEGARIEAVDIVVERDRLLVAADPMGIFDLPRPDKPPAAQQR
jgi:hypothetical protein